MNGGRIHIVLKRLTDFPLTVPLVLSLVIHIAVYATYKEIKNLNWKGQQEILRYLFPSSKYQMTFNPAQFLAEKFNFLKYSRAVEEQKKQQIMQSEPPLLFVSVAPSQQTLEPPEKAKFYSDKNSIAANPNIKKETGEPNIDGKQDKVVQTLDIPKPTKPQPPLEKPKQEPPVKQVEKKPEELKPAPQPLQPLPEQKTVQKQIAEKPANENKTEEKPGNTRRSNPSEKMVKTESAVVVSGQPNTAEKGDGSQHLSRPITLAEARARQQEGLIAGEKYKQEGGVRRVNMVPSVDAKATPFGAYDSSVFYAIQQRWYDLLDNAKYTGDRRGKVVVDFRLHYDGRVSNVKIVESTVGELLSAICRMAIEDPAPFEKWPSDMRKMIGEDYREVRITFYYL